MHGYAEQVLGHAAHFAVAQQALGFVTWIWDGVGESAKWLGDMAPLLGLPPGSFSGSYADYQKALHPADLLESRRVLKACLKGERRAYRSEERVIWPDGSVHWLETYGCGSYGADGRAVALSGVVRDITHRKQLEEERARSEEKFSITFDACPDCIVIIGAADQRILDVNPAFSRITGYAAAQAIGRTSVELGLWARPGERDRYFAVLREQGGVQNFVADLRMRDGAVMHAMLAASLTVMNGEQVVVSTARDLTELEIAQQKNLQLERIFRAVFETSPEPMSITRQRDSRILELNEACARQIGLPRARMIGRPTTELADYADLAERTEVMDRLAAEGVVSNRLTRLRRADGTMLDLLESCKSIDIEGEACVVWMWRDVSERRRAEAALADLNESLEKRVRERTADLEAANRELDSFTHSVSHDLRAPLFQIGGFADLLRKDRASTLSADAARFLERIENGAQQMSQLLEALLGFSIAGRAALRRAPVDMQALVGEVLMMLRGTESARAEIRVADLPSTRGDAVLLRQVWQNLIGNALKFSRHAPAPCIEIGAERRGTGVEYFVRDNGAGFDGRQAGRLFGVFERLHSAEEFEGTGAGLSIVKRIVERHGGSIAADGEPGRGACLRFTLPA